MDNVGIVVESLDDAITFFEEIGLTLEGRAMVEGEWAGRVTGLDSQQVEIAMMATPDGHSRLELSRFFKSTNHFGPSYRTRERSRLSSSYVHCRRH
jgi:hypothetical protein